MGFFSWFGPASRNSKTAQEAKEEAVAASTLQMPTVPSWTEDDQRELDSLDADFKHRNEEERQKYFMSLPEEIRLAIVDAYKLEAVSHAIQQLGYKRVPMSQRHLELQSKLHRSRATTHFMSFAASVEDGSMALQHYEELSKLHAEASTKEIILDDKKK